MQAKTQAIHGHILDATRMVLFFGAPHDGMHYQARSYSSGYVLGLGIATDEVVAAAPRRIGILGKSARRACRYLEWTQDY